MPNCRRSGGTKTKNPALSPGAATRIGFGFPKRQRRALTTAWGNAPGHLSHTHQSPVGAT